MKLTEKVAKLVKEEVEEVNQEVQKVEAFATEYVAPVVNHILEMAKAQAEARKLKDIYHGFKE